ncbi:MAG: hypothetical protein FWD73_01490 [Polyangiaceae bacterium]|nr:hypothetical protein [Polyangiaceae bacterium]
MRVTEALAEDLRLRAERCLASPSPSVVDAHELAILSLEFLARVAHVTRISDEAIAAQGGGAYRALQAWPNERSIGVDEHVQTARVVALERALDECRARLHVALAELEARK